MSNYNIMVPIKIFAVLLGLTVLAAILFVIYVRKVTYTVGEFREKRSYYEPRFWTIGLTAVVLILFMGYSR